MYKNNNISIEKSKKETHSEHMFRLWFVLKNVHLVNTFLKGENKVDMNLLVHYSFIHLKIKKYKHVFDEDIMSNYRTFESNVYLKMD